MEGVVSYLGLVGLGIPKNENKGQFCFHIPFGSLLFQQLYAVNVGGVGSRFILTQLSVYVVGSAIVFCAENGCKCAKWYADSTGLKNACIAEVQGQSMLGVCVLSHRCDYDGGCCWCKAVWGSDEGPTYCWF